MREGGGWWGFKELGKHSVELLAKDQELGKCKVQLNEVAEAEHNLGSAVGVQKGGAGGRGGVFELLAKDQKLGTIKV